MSDQKMQKNRSLRTAISKLRGGFARLSSANHIQPYALTLLFGVSLAGTAYAASIMPHDPALANQRMAALQLTAAVPNSPSVQNAAKPTPQFTEQAMPEMPSQVRPSESGGVIPLSDAEFAGIDPIITGPSSHNQPHKQHWLR